MTGPNGRCHREIVSTPSRVPRARNRRVPFKRALYRASALRWRQRDLLRENHRIRRRDRETPQRHVRRRSIRVEILELSRCRKSLAVEEREEDRWKKKDGKRGRKKKKKRQTPSAEACNCNDDDDDYDDDGGGGGGGHCWPKV
ncbi:uncharacterized protein LOC120358075 [Solenopsis invicta]|uniref:uncharacterized protein LOC120358075 n=1 Tax=Solenopsis invicta TaxID=13686 RepID=UPI00193E1C3D|nr:uncharacterized protein LOC120358075 [Solenopsis invicta]